MTDLTHAQAPSFASFKTPVCLSARLIQVLFGLAIALGRTSTTPLPGGKPRSHASQQAGNWSEGPEAYRLRYMQFL